MRKEEVLKIVKMVEDALVATGVNLVAVDYLRKARMAIQETMDMPGLSGPEKQLVKDKRKIHAIKSYMDRIGCTLKFAANAVNSEIYKDNTSRLEEVWYGEDKDYSS